MCSVQIHIGDVYCVDNDIDAVGLDVDVLMVKGGEGHVTDALFHWGNPHHGRVTVAA